MVALQAPLAPAELAAFLPPLGVLRKDKTMGLPPKAFANPPYGTTYRAYSGYPSSLAHNTRNLPEDVKGSKTFFGWWTKKNAPGWHTT